MIDAVRINKQGMEEIWGPHNNTEENIKAYAFYSMRIDEEHL